MTWRTLPTQSRIDLVKEHWCAGYSASDIARSISARIGDAVTRRAIIGMYTRYPAEFVRHPLQGRRRASVSHAPMVIRMPIAPQQARFVPLVDLRDRGDCKWPVNDPKRGDPIYFAGARPIPDRRGVTSMQSLFSGRAPRASGQRSRQQ